MSLPANFPGALDALANPTATTKRNDVGFELDLVVSRIHDILEALEAKVGIGSSAPAATPAVLRRTAAGTSMWQKALAADIDGGGTANRALTTADGATAAWGPVTGAMIAAGTVSKVALDYNLSGSDLGVSLSAGVWTNFTPNQLFTVTDPASLLACTVRGTIMVTSPTVNAQAFVRVLVQSATAYGPIGGAQLLVANGYVNALAGSSTVVIPVPSPGTAGSYQILVQVYCSVAATAYCRVSSLSSREALNITVLEYVR